MKITGKLKNYVVPFSKRPYLPGIELSEVICKHCLKETEVSFDSHYPDSIESDGTFTLYFLCDHCEEGLEVELQMNLSVAVKSK